MAGELARRNAMKAAAVGGLLALGGSAAGAQPDRNSPWAGEWLHEGKDDKPCAIFQHGRILLLVNELMHLAVGQITAARKIVVRDAHVWSDKTEGDALVGVLSPDGKVISWDNNSKWKRP